MPTYRIEGHLTLEEQFRIKAHRTRHLIGLEVGHLLDNSLVIRPVAPIQANHNEQTSIDPTAKHSGYTTIKLPIINNYS